MEHGGKIICIVERPRGVHNFIAAFPLLSNLKEIPSVHNSSFDTDSHQRDSLCRPVCGFLELNNVSGVPRLQVVHLKVVWADDEGIGFLAGDAERK